MFAENNMANNIQLYVYMQKSWIYLLPSSDRICKKYQIMKIKNVRIDWFPAQINDIYKRHLTWYLKVSLEGHCLTFLSIRVVSVISYIITNYILSVQEYISLDGDCIHIFLANGKKRTVLTPLEPFDRLIYAAPVNLYVGWNCAGTKMQVRQLSVASITHLTCTSLYSLDVHLLTVFIIIIIIFFLAESFKCTKLRYCPTNVSVARQRTRRDIVLHRPWSHTLRHLQWTHKWGHCFGTRLYYSECCFVNKLIMKRLAWIECISVHSGIVAVHLGVRTRIYRTCDNIATFHLFYMLCGLDLSVESWISISNLLITYNATLIIMRACWHTYVIQNSILAVLW